MAKCLTLLSKEEFKKLFASIDVILSDCDGVLWRETDVIKGSPETVDKFKELGKKFFYVTNNNTKTRAEFVEKCKGLNYKASMEEIVCTSFLAAAYLKEKKLSKKAYIIGSIGIAKELEEQGIQSCGVGLDHMDGDELDLIMDFKPDPNVGAVVVGFDKYFSYPKLMKAATYLQNHDIHFVGTNCDTHRPSPNSNRFPGSGCFIKAIEMASNRSAVVVGKPETFLSNYIVEKYGLTPGRTLMVGDNCNTDILLGKRCGFKTLLVLSGVSSKADVDVMNEKPESTAAVPDYFTNQLSDILQMLV